MGLVPMAFETLALYTCGFLKASLNGSIDCDFATSATLYGLSLGLRFGDLLPLSCRESSDRGVKHYSYAGNAFKIVSFQLSKIRHTYD
jgi:hypothetical protein